MARDHFAIPLLFEGEGRLKLANLLTLSRLFAIPLILALLWANHDWMALEVYLVAILTDLADGHVARVTGTASEFGARLDAIIDNVFSIAILPFLLLAFPGLWADQALILTALFAVPVLYLAVSQAWKGRLLMYHFWSAKTGALLLFLAWPLLAVTGWQGWTVLAAAVIVGSRLEQIIYMARGGLDLDAPHGFVAVERDRVASNVRAKPAIGRGKAPRDLLWYAETPDRRGPVLTSPHPARNAIGVHAGSYAPYRAIGLVTGELNAAHEPDFHNCQPMARLPWRPGWSRPGSIVTMDPFGHDIGAFRDEPGWRPSIAVTEGHLDLAEVHDALKGRRLRADGQILSEAGHARCLKIAIEPVWYLPGVAERLGVGELELRRALFNSSGGAWSDLIERTDLKVFLPPAGGQSVYLFGDPEKLGNPHTSITCRMHDECNGSDVFGSTLCTCRPYLTFALEEAIRQAQSGGVGILVYSRKEGRSLGEVTKYLVYNARQRDPRGDQSENYFDHTRAVAGTEDLRAQLLSGDVLHWLGVDHIDRWVSMSNLKSEAIAMQGIDIRQQVALPADRVPADANVEIAAKIGAGYFSDLPIES
nr:GTP cyclohydrolase II [Notoacmeibacter sp. MSK16QG-6]